MSDRFMVI